MKNYFSFNLTGRKLLPIWVIYMVVVIAPYIFLTLQRDAIATGGASAFMTMVAYIFIIVVAYLIVFYITRLIIKNIGYKENTIDFDGSFGEYVGKILLGFFLSIITLGIYLPWFIRTIMSFFTDNSSYNSNAFKFKGKGGRLFVVFLLSLIVPLILITLMLVIFDYSSEIVGMVIVVQLATFIIMIPYMYLVYKWMVNIDYKELNISWKTNFWSSCGKIFIELFLSIITLGIYWPLAIIRLYKYFAERTFAHSDERTLQFGYDIEQLSDFLFIWGQLLLTIITLGIYYPWALSKIGGRVLGKTYLVER